MFKQPHVTLTSPLISRAAVAEASGIPSVALKPLEGMVGLDVTVATSRARDAAALSALMKLCQGWQKPGAIVKAQCVLTSRSRFEVDSPYHANIIAAFKQMPSKNYGEKGLCEMQ